MIKNYTFIEATYKFGIKKPSHIPPQFLWSNFHFPSCLLTNTL